MTATAAATDLVGQIQSIILFPLIALMIGIALLVFMWGSFQFISNADSDTGREAGKKHMLWGFIGMLIMVSAYGILSIAVNTIPGINIPS